MPSAITIPKRIQSDRVYLRLVMIWRMKLERFALIQRRVNPYNPNRSLIESRRTLERRTLASAIRVIENDLLNMLADDTHHPDLYMRIRSFNADPLHPSTYSTRMRLIRDWVVNSKLPGATNPKRLIIARQRTTRRHTLARQIQDLEWRWLAALHLRCFPHHPLPPRRLVNVRRFKP